MWNYHISGYEESSDGKPTTIPFSDGSGDFHGVCACTLITAEAVWPFAIRFNVELKSAASKHRPSSPAWTHAKERLEPLVKLRDANFYESSPLDLIFITAVPKGVSFCDHAIQIIGEIFKLLGIEDPKGDIRGNFEITQATLIRQYGKWVPYVDWLRKRHGLAAPYIYNWTN